MFRGLDLDMLPVYRPTPLAEAEGATETPDSETMPNDTSQGLIDGVVRVHHTFQDIVASYRSTTRSAMAIQLGEVERKERAAESHTHAPGSTRLATRLGTAALVTASLALVPLEFPKIVKERLQHDRQS